MGVEESRVESVFYAALEKNSAAERAAFLDEACADDSALRHRVELLLDAQPNLGRFLENNAAGIAPTLDMAPIAERVGMKIGRYKLVHEIGHGGMGVVYMAVQKEPVKRKVALKIIKPGMDTREVLARFEAERQALALMDHQCIATVHDGGTTESGRPYFVMELVEGTKITEYCDACRYTTRQRLELFIQVCQAVQHAHQKGVIHRDIKPSNILVSNHDDRAVPKVIDFGVAKALHHQLTDHSVYTQVSQMVGTPLYMSPEQAQRTGVDVDTHTDVYSLGVLLYELLTGTTPFDKERLQTSGLDEFKRIIREEEPPKPSTRLTTVDAALETVADKHSTDIRTLTRELSGELDWIVMKALEKDRTRRYESARDFAKDIQRHLDDEPVEACPPSTIYRLRKFARRHKAQLVTLATIAAILVIATVVSTALAAWAVREKGIASENLIVAKRNEATADRERAGTLDARTLAKKQERLAKQQRDVAERSVYLAHMRLAQRDLAAGQTARLCEMLDEHFPQPGRPDFRVWEWYYFLSRCQRDLLTIREHTVNAKSVTWSPVGPLLAWAGYDGVVRVWDIAARQQVLALSGHEADVYSVAWSPDGKHIATGSQDRTIRLWDAVKGRQVHILREHGSAVVSLAWSANSKRLASASWDGTVKIWGVDSPDGDMSLQQTHVEPVTWSCQAWSPDGSRLVGRGPGDRITIWNVDEGLNGGAVREIAINNPTCGAWSPDGERLATGELFVNSVKVWDAETGQLLRTLKGHNNTVNSLAWSPDGEQLASASVDQSVRIWDADTGQLLRTLYGHTATVHSVAWSADGRMLASAADDDTVKVWSAAEDGPLPLFQHPSAVRFVVWSPDGQRIASADAERAVRVWDANTGQQMLKLFEGADGGISDVSWHPNGSQLAVCRGQTVDVRNAVTGESVFALGGHPSAAMWADWSPDGKRFASISRIGSRLELFVKMWDPATGEETLAWRADQIYAGSPAAWSPDSRRLAATGIFGAKIWDAATGKELCSLAAYAGKVRSIAWSPQGERIATSSDNGQIMVWDAATGQEVLGLFGHSGRVPRMAWSPGGRRLASASIDGSIRIWDGDTGREIVTLRKDSGAHPCLAWNPDGKRLAAAGDDGTIKIWDASSGYQLAANDSYPQQITRRQVTRLTETGQLQNAIEMLHKLVDEFPDSPDYRKQLARAYFRRAHPSFHIGNREQALHDFDQAVQFDPNHAEAYDHRADIHIARGDWDRAIADYTEAIRLGPLYPQAYLRRAVAYLEKDEYKKALADFDETDWRELGHANFRFRYALVTLSADDLTRYHNVCSETLRHFSKTDDAEAGHWIAWTCALAPDAVDDFSVPISLAEKAVENEPKSVSYVNTLGAILYRAGRLEEAIQQLTEANKLIEAPNVGTLSSPAYTWYFLAMAHQANGQTEEAKKWLGRAVEWTDKAVREDEEGTASLSWNRELTLKLLREEAEAMINESN